MRWKERTVRFALGYLGFIWAFTFSLSNSVTSVINNRHFWERLECNKNFQTFPESTDTLLRKGGK